MLFSFRGCTLAMYRASDRPPVGGERRSCTMTYVQAPGYQEQHFLNLEGLDGLSPAQIAEHLALYAGYVRQVNVLNDRLAALRAQGRASGRDAEFTELTRRLGFEYNGMILHEYYFLNLRPAADPEPPAGSGLTEALAGSFGAVERWQTDFRAIGGLRG